MKIVSKGYGRYKCPYCNTVVELQKKDVQQWNEVLYYDCPVCGETPHIKGGNFWCPYDIEGKKAIKID